MKIIGTIVNNNLTLVGLRMKGKASEFGGFNSDEQVHDIQIRELLQKRFKNGQLDCRSGQLREINSFRLKNLPMLYWNQNDGTMREFDNSITLHRRVLVNGELKGFEATIGGIKGAFQTKNIIQMSGWFNTTNFVVRFAEDKAFIAGKPGHSIEKLPAIERGTPRDSSKRAKVKTVQESSPKNVHNPVISNEFDIITLYDIIDSLGGKIIYLPTESYKKTKVATHKTASNFINFGAGQIGSPRIDYTEKNLNVNINFTKVGIVNVQLTTGMQTVYPYTMAKKTVFWNGVNYVNKFAIAIQESDIPTLQERFAGSLALESYENPVVTQPIKAFMGDTGNTVRFFLVDVSKLDIINKNKINEYRLSNKEIYNLALKLVQDKSYYAYVNGVSRSAKETITSKGHVLPKPKYGPYAGLSEADLLMLQDAGIDVFTGMFVGKEETDEKTDKDAEELRDLLDGKKPKVQSDIEVEFQIKGMATNMSYKDCVNKAEKALVKADPKFAEKLFKLVDTFEAMKDINKMYLEAEKVKESLNKHKADIIKKLWFHKMACLADGDYSQFKVTNINDWETGKAIKNGVTYQCVDPEAIGLIMKVSGIELA